MFFGAQKFRDFMLDSDPMIKGDIIICFRPTDTFNVQFQQIAAKVIGVIAFTEEGKEELASHRELLQMCQGVQPFVCIKPGYAMINKNKRLQALRLEEPIKSFRGFTYCPYSTYYDLKESTTDTILRGEVSETENNKQN